MNFITKSIITTLIAAILTGCSGITNNPDNIDTLIITSNNYESRTLAEHLQVRNKQLIITIPANKADNNLYVVGPGEEMPLPISQEKFASFIHFTAPKNIIILGNEIYVPNSFTNQINPNLTKYILNDKDWKLIAWQLEELTGYCGLAEDYIETLDELIHSKTIESQFAPSNPSEPQAIIPQN